jgi:hypothetical protein
MDLWISGSRDPEKYRVSGHPGPEIQGLDLWTPGPRDPDAQGVDLYPSGSNGLKIQGRISGFLGPVGWLSELRDPAQLGPAPIVISLCVLDENHIRTIFEIHKKCFTVRLYLTIYYNKNARYNRTQEQNN